MTLQCLLSIDFSQYLLRAGVILSAASPLGELHFRGRYRRSGCWQRNQRNRSAGLYLQPMACYRRYFHCSRFPGAAEIIISYSAPRILLARHGTHDARWPASSHACPPSAAAMSYALLVVPHARAFISGGISDDGHAALYDEIRHAIIRQQHRSPASRLS